MFIPSSVSSSEKRGGLSSFHFFIFYNSVSLMDVKLIMPCEGFEALISTFCLNLFIQWLVICSKFKKTKKRTKKEKSEHLVQVEGMRCKVGPAECLRFAARYHWHCFFFAFVFVSFYNALYRAFGRSSGQQRNKKKKRYRHSSLALLSGTSRFFSALSQ